MATAGAAYKRMLKSDDLFIWVINNIHSEGPSCVDIPATVIAVLKNTINMVPDVVLHRISDVRVFSTAHLIMKGREIGVLFDFVALN